MQPFRRSVQQSSDVDLNGRVSVLIPTLRRYPYLRTLLGQLRVQTLPPLEIMVIDQTPEKLRDPDLLRDFDDLPIRYFTMDQAGQCTSRNLGIKEAKGDFILFIDDDDEIEPDLIEKHLVSLHHFGINISNGVANQVDVENQPADLDVVYISSVFPTNNSMVRKSVLEKSGLFDLAYDHGQRADHDLGMRLYLAGEMLVLNPDIQVLHHHAPVGGLRQHKARVNTRAESRQKLNKFNLSTTSDFYLAKRYYSKEQVKERNWINLLGTFSLKGSAWRKCLKMIIGIFYLPRNLWLIKKRSNSADLLLHDYPQIPSLCQEKLT